MIGGVGKLALNGLIDRAKGAISGDLMDTGGTLQTGRAALNLSGRPEQVLDPETTAALQMGLKQGFIPPMMRIYIGDQEIKALVRVEIEHEDGKVTTAIQDGRR